MTNSDVIYIKNGIMTLCSIGGVLCAAVVIIMLLLIFKRND